MEQHTSVASGVDASLYPVAVLIDELRHDDLQLRLNSIRNLSTIATALGPERTREELVPFLQEIVDDDDEVLIALAEQLGQGVPWVGGPAHAHALIGPLEQLCNIEEISVREKATEAIRELAQHMSADQAIRHLCVLLQRLASHEWLTSKISACSIFSAALAKVGEAKQEELLRIYFRLCGDDAPMVRRQAAKVLDGVAATLEDEMLLGELLENFENLAKDEQDSVRIMAIRNCIALGRLKNSPEWQEKILEVIKACGEDKSWRVRYMMVDNVKPLCEVFQAQATTSIIPLYIRLMADQEVEVRTIAAARVAAVAGFNPTREFLQELLPAMEKLTLPQELSQHVRASLAGSILSLTPTFGPQLTADFLVTVFLRLIGDECPDVRLRLIGTLGELSTVLGIDVLSQALLPSIKELGKDRQWRVRLGVIECMPSLARHLGEPQFTKELADLLPEWLVDPVFSVRDATSSIYRKLCGVLGLKWCELHVVPQLQDVLTHSNYLYRISAVLAAGTLAEVARGSFLDDHLVPIVAQMSNDPVPNVRFNAIKVIEGMHKACVALSPGALENTLVPRLRRLVADEDPDVKFFAQRAMSEIGVA